MVNLTDLFQNAIDIYGEEEAYSKIMAIQTLTRNADKTKEIIEGEKWYNCYTEVESYLNIASAMVNEKCLWEENPQDPHKKELEEFIANNNEEGAREALVENGWFLFSDFSFAILLDKEEFAQY